MINILETIKRQATIFAQVRDFLQTDWDNEYGYNIPMEYDIILNIYNQVNQDLRDGGLRYTNDMIYTKQKEKHGYTR